MFLRIDAPIFGSVDGGGEVIRLRGEASSIRGCGVVVFVVVVCGDCLLLARREEEKLVLLLLL